MVFLLVWAGENASSDPAGDGGSNVSGLGALVGSCDWSSVSPKCKTLISLSVRSISPSLSHDVALCFNFFRCCVVDATKCEDPCWHGLYLQQETSLNQLVSFRDARLLIPNGKP